MISRRTNGQKLELRASGYIDPSSKSLLDSELWVSERTLGPSSAVRLDDGVHECSVSGTIAFKHVSYTILNCVGGDVL